MLKHDILFQKRKKFILLKAGDFMKTILRKSLPYTSMIAALCFA